MPSDRDLVAAVRRGDDRAFELLYGRYGRRISAYVSGMAGDHGRAEDITQEVFISALRRMRATERPIAFKPWIYEIAKNACIDNFRRTSRADEISYDADDGLGAADAGRLAAEAGPSPDAALDAKQQLDHLCGAFGGLSETHHRILVMRELEGLSYREIGERLGMSRPSVESTLFRARRRLSEEYEELVSGRRCLRIQSIIAGAAEGALGTRDRRRLARHVAHCQPCRRHASMAGLDSATLERRRLREAVGAGMAALLPLPALLRIRRGPDDPVSAITAAAGGHQAAAQNLSTVAGMSDSAVTGWGNVAAAAVALVIAGGAAGVGEHVSSPQKNEREKAAATASTGQAGSQRASTAAAPPVRQAVPPAQPAAGRRSNGVRSASAGSVRRVRDNRDATQNRPATRPSRPRIGDRPPGGGVRAPNPGGSNPAPQPGPQAPLTREAPSTEPSPGPQRSPAPAPSPVASAPSPPVQPTPSPDKGGIEVRVPLPGADKNAVKVAIPDPVQVVTQVTEPVVNAVKDTVGGVLGLLGGGGRDDDG